jgi:hypothetical protein
MRLFSAIPLALLISLGACATASAEQLQMPAEGTMNEAPDASMDMPSKGMSEDQVREAYGKPVKVIPPVGEPPITRWVYDSYTVYFEYTHVIHSVPNH